MLGLWFGLPYGLRMKRWFRLGLGYILSYDIVYRSQYHSSKIWIVVWIMVGLWFQFFSYYALSYCSWCGCSYGWQYNLIIDLVLVGLYLIYTLDYHSAYPFSHMIFFLFKFFKNWDNYIIYCWNIGNPFCVKSVYKYQISLLINLMKI